MPPSPPRPVDDRAERDRHDLLALAASLQAMADQYERARDGRCVFAFAYALMTRRLAEVFDADQALDSHWIAVLGAHFGRRYLDALDAADHDRPPPPAWAHAFGVLRMARTSALEDLLFCMTVHIVRDLPHALCDAGLSVDGRSRLREFHHVNDVMDQTIDDVQEMVGTRYEPYARVLDRFAANHDELLTNYGIRVSRAVAWYNANRLLDPASADEAARSIERSPRIFIELITNPPFWSLRLLFRLFRMVASWGRRWPAASH
jgi:Family of unknown function (DUF5995)